MAANPLLAVQRDRSLEDQPARNRLVGMDYPFAVWGLTWRLERRILAAWTAATTKGPLARNRPQRKRAVVAVHTHPKRSPENEPAVCDGLTFGRN